jgi:hypothetical protein
MSTRKFHLDEQDIPDGFQIFEERLEVAGVSYRKQDAIAFATAKTLWLELEPDPGNKHDSNAIKVIGCSKGWFFTKRRFVGYVPKEVAKGIVEGGFFAQVRPRLLKTYVGDRGFVEILFQLLGPKGIKHEYRQSTASKDDHIALIERLCHEKKYEEAIQELLVLVDSTEKAARKRAQGVTPWYYERLAIIYRKQKRYADEVSILERFEAQPTAQGALPAQLVERLVKARQLRDRQRG